MLFLKAFYEKNFFGRVEILCYCGGNIERLYVKKLKLLSAKIML
jgi:hypothetical protein